MIIKKLFYFMSIALTISNRQLHKLYAAIMHTDICLVKRVYHKKFVNLCIWHYSNLTSMQDGRNHNNAFYIERINKNGDN